MPDTDCFMKGVKNPTRIQGFKKNDDGSPLAQTEHTLIIIDGPGTFISAAISKLGGVNDHTFVILDIDGRNVVFFRMDFAKLMGLEKENNPYGIVFHKGRNKVKTLTIGFSTPLYISAEKRLILKVKVEENNVTKIVADVVFGTADGRPPEETGGRPEPPQP